MPVLILLLALAQLSTAAHWHLDEHSVVDCNLCVLQAGGEDAQVGYAASTFPSTSNNSAWVPSPSAPQASIRQGFSIRAPPGLTLV